MFGLMGFYSQWIAMIMDCVRSNRYVVKCNSSVTNEIHLKRGLHKGDPFSPYLFLFCLEAFSCMLLNA